MDAVTARIDNSCGDRALTQPTLAKKFPAFGSGSRHSFVYASVVRTLRFDVRGIFVPQSDRLAAPTIYISTTTWHQSPSLTVIDVSGAPLHPLALDSLVSDKLLATASPNSRFGC